MKKEETMNIVCATDDNYVPLCGIMVTSLLENNRDCHVVIYILTKGLNTYSRNMFSKLLDKNNYDAEIHICEVNNDMFKHCPVRTGDHISLAAYYRLLIPYVLPRHVDKALYLDCDIMVDASLNDLYTTNISNVALAACAEHDGEIGLLQISESHIQRLDYPIEWGYFNSGVLLINLSYWREHKISEALFAYIEKNKDKCLCHDQDVLNAVLGGQKRFLPYKYNFMTYLFTSGFAQYDKTVFLQERPVIIHFCTPAKPWDWYLPDYPFKQQWEHYRKISPWKRWRGNKPLCEQIRRQLLVWLHILRKKEFNVYEDSWKKWEQ